MDYSRNINTFAGVTTDAINYICDAKIYHQGKQVRLKENNGSAIVSTCMYLLGFNKEANPSLILRSVSNAKDSPTTPEMLVRSPVHPSYAEYAKVYTGRLRNDYTPDESLHKWFKNIHFDGDLMHIISDGKVLLPVSDFGND
jgi:hypothetical protein